MEVEREGFYPKGGARVRARFEPTHIREPFDLSERGELQEIEGLSIASQHLQKSGGAERQAEAAYQLLRTEFSQISVTMEMRYTDTLSPGSAVVLWAICDKTISWASKEHTRLLRSLLRLIILALEIFLTSLYTWGIEINARWFR